MAVNIQSTERLHQGGGRRRRHMVWEKHKQEGEREEEEIEKEAGITLPRNDRRRNDFRERQLIHRAQRLCILLIIPRTPLILPSVLLIVKLPVRLASFKRATMLLPNRISSTGEPQLSPDSRTAGQVDSVIVTVNELDTPVLLMVALDHTDTGRVTDPYPLLPRGHGPGGGAVRVGWGFSRRARRLGTHCEVQVRPFWIGRSVYSHDWGQHRKRRKTAERR